MLINFKYQKFSLRVLLSFCFIFCQFQPGVPYKSVAYKKSVHLHSSYIQLFHCYVITVKCRLVPNNDHTIPRLELLACLLLPFHMNTFIESISKQIEIHRIYCWTDSQISLWSIRLQTKTWKVWILNRVNKRRNFLPLNSQKFIRTHENPADISTRRNKPDAFLNKTLW